MLRALPKTALLLAIVGLIAVNIFVYRLATAPRALTVSVLEVAGGTAVLVRTPSGETLLINAGKDASILRALGKRLPFWKRRLDAAIVTRVDAASAGGMGDALARYPSPLLLRPAPTGSRTLESTLPSAVDLRCPQTCVRVVSRGDRLTLGGGVVVDVLWPLGNVSRMNISDGALVLLISYGRTSVLIDPSLPPRAARYLTSLNASLPPPNLTISSSTSPTVFTSDGLTVTKK